MQGHLIAFTAVPPAEQPDNSNQIQTIYLYNPDIDTWDYVSFTPGHNWVRVIQIKDGVIFVVGSITSKAYTGKDDDLVKSCFTVSFTVTT